MVKEVSKGDYQAMFNITGSLLIRLPKGLTLEDAVAKAREIKDAINTDFEWMDYDIKLTGVYEG
jgi:hypothetical protein